MTSHQFNRWKLVFTLWYSRNIFLFNMKIEADSGFIHVGFTLFCLLFVVFYNLLRLKLVSSYLEFFVWLTYLQYSIFSKFFVHEIVVSKTVVTRVNVKSLQCLIDYDIGVANIFEGNCTGNMKVIALTSSIKFCFGILTANYVVEWLISLWVCKVLLYGSFFTTTCVAHSSNKLVSIYLF